MNGDFLNYDFQIHKESKISNFSEYDHGPYGEGSVRHRKMYTYPNPLNSKIKYFYHKFLLVDKDSNFKLSKDQKNITSKIIRTDQSSQNFNFLVRDDLSQNNASEIECIEDIFENCKKRSKKIRTAPIFEIG